MWILFSIFLFVVNRIFFFPKKKANVLLKAKGGNININTFHIADLVALATEY